LVTGFYLQAILSRPQRMTDIDQPASTVLEFAMTIKSRQGTSMPWQARAGSGRADSQDRMHAMTGDGQELD
jgi:hypothetical protein